jgi:predicted HD superfamily hydrolase involved in NAD metabolism
LEPEVLLRLEHVLPFLRANLKRKRFLHSLGVMHYATVLAQRHREDLIAAAAAGLLHDCGRRETAEEIGLEAHRRNVAIPPEDHEFDKVWHALLSADIAATDFGITDERVLRAIRVHPTADAHMTRLDMVVFLADYLEPTRQFEGLKELRILAERDLEAAFRRALEVKTNHIARRGLALHPRSIEALAAFGPHPPVEVSLSSPPEKRLDASPESAMR